MRRDRLVVVLCVSLCIVLFPIIVLSCVALYNMTNSIDNVLSVFGYVPVIVGSVPEDSEIGLSSGDIAVFESVGEDGIVLIGDRICYSVNNSIRIETVYDTDNVLKGVIYSGKNKDSINTMHVDQIIGRYVFSIKNFGDVIMFIGSPIGTLLCVLISVSAFVLIFNISRKVSRDGHKDESNDYIVK